jgi:hypothetical protein
LNIQLCWDLGFARDLASGLRPDFDGDVDADFDPDFDWHLKSEADLEGDLYLVLSGRSQFSGHWDWMWKLDAEFAA